MCTAWCFPAQGLNSSSCFPIAVLKKVRYALCPMPYALCPMPYALCPVVPHMRARKAIVSSIEEADDFAKKAGFPEHALVVVMGEAALGNGEIVKGIRTEKQLFDAVTAGLKKSSTGRVHIETDMRAMYNPTRMKNIENATLDLE